MRCLIGKVLIGHVYTWIDGVFYIYVRIVYCYYPRPGGDGGQARPDHDLSQPPTDGRRVFGNRGQADKKLRSDSLRSLYHEKEMTTAESEK